jgi:hypothetical protein
LNGLDLPRGGGEDGRFQAACGRSDLIAGWAARFAERASPSSDAGLDWFLKYPSEVGTRVGWVAFFSSSPKSESVPVRLLWGSEAGVPVFFAADRAVSAADQRAVVGSD